MRKRNSKKPTKEPKEKKEGNLFDKIFKENAEATFVSLAAKKLGIEIVSYRALPEKSQTTIEREADFLLLIETSDGETYILHIEFQTQNDSEMVYRLAEYHGIELRKYQLEIKHVVIYLGETPPNMVPHLQPKEIYTGFELVAVHELDVLTEKIVTTMPIVYDITEDTFYQRGAAQERKLMTEEVQENNIAMIKKFLENDVAVAIIAVSFGVTQAYIKKIQKEMKQKK